MTSSEGPRSQPHAALGPPGGRGSSFPRHPDGPALARQLVTAVLHDDTDGIRAVLADVTTVHAGDEAEAHRAAVARLAWFVAEVGNVAAGIVQSMADNPDEALAQLFTSAERGR